MFVPVKQPVIPANTQIAFTVRSRLNVIYARIIFIILRICAAFISA